MAYHNAILVKQNLWKRKILTEDLCEHCHSIWHRRNQLRVWSRDFPVSQVLPQATQSLTDFKHFNVTLPHQRRDVKNPQVRSQWSPPPRDCFKINFDGATFSDLGKAGLGVVVRDSNGSVV